MSQHENTNKNSIPISAKIESVATSISLPHISGAARINALLKRGEPEDYQRMQELLKEIDSPRLLEFIGEGLGTHLPPTAVPLACELLKMGSYATTASFLGRCAAIEYAHFIKGRPPALQGDAYSPIRFLIAKVAVFPEYAFSQKEWELHQHEIADIPLFPLTILRRCAGKEIDALLTDALARGGICQYMNSRALQLLLFREQSDCSRVLSDDEIMTLLKVHGDELRDFECHAHIASIVDLWLGKTGDEKAHEKEQHIVALLSERLRAHLSREGDLPTHHVDNILQTLRLLKHFKENLSITRLLAYTAEHPHAGISSYAQLTLRDSAPRSIAHLTNRLLESTDAQVRSQALHAFSQPLSHIAESLMRPYFEEYLAIPRKPDFDSPESTQGFAMERAALLHSVLVRFLSEPSSSPFLQRILEGLERNDNIGVSALAINTFFQVAACEKIPPLSFYDNISNIKIAEHIARRLTPKKNQDDGEPSTHAPTLSPAVLVRSVFLNEAPKLYGLEVAYD